MFSSTSRVTALFPHPSISFGHQPWLSTPIGQFRPERWPRRVGRRLRVGPGTHRVGRRSRPALGRALAGLGRLGPATYPPWTAVRRTVDPVAQRIVVVAWAATASRKTSIIRARSSRVGPGRLIQRSWSLQSLDACVPSTSRNVPSALVRQQCSKARRLRTRKSGHVVVIEGRPDEEQVAGQEQALGSHRARRPGVRGRALPDEVLAREHDLPGSRDVSVHLEDPWVSRCSVPPLAERW